MKPTHPNATLCVFHTIKESSSKHLKKSPRANERCRAVREKEKKIKNNGVDGILCLAASLKQ